MRPTARGSGPAGAPQQISTRPHEPSYRRAVQATFARPNPWLYAAGVMGSFGQILYFAALNASPMSTVALVASMEVFITLALALLFLAERLSWRVAAAALLGFAGTVLLVTGPSVGV